MDDEVVVIHYVEEAILSMPVMTGALDKESEEATFP